MAPFCPPPIPTVSKSPIVTNCTAAPHPSCRDVYWEPASLHATMCAAASGRRATLPDFRIGNDLRSTAPAGIRTAP